MARLTDPSAAQRPVPRAPRGVTQLATVGPSPAPGRGLESLGRDIAGAAEEIYRAQRIEEDRINTLRAEEAYTQLRTRALDLREGDEGFSKLRGSAAVNRPILTEWSGKFQDVETELTTGLANDEQRQRFKQRADLARVAFQEDILRHLAREGDSYAKEVFQGTLATEIRNATARWDAPNEVAASLVRLDAAVEAQAERHGWAPEYSKAVAQEERSKIHAAVIGQALASGQYAYAEQWYEKNRPDIDVQTAKVLERQVVDGAQRQLAGGYRNEFIAQRDNRLGLEELQTRIAADSKLDLDRQNALLGPIASRLETLQHREEIRAERRLRGIEKGINQLNARTLAGFEPAPDEFLPFIAAAKGTELEPEVRSAITLAAATRNFRLATPREQEAMLNNLESQMRTHPGSVDVKVLSAMKTIHEAQGRLLKESPVTFAYRQGLAEPFRLDLGNPAAVSEQMFARVATARAMSQVYATPLKPLLPDEVGEIRARLDRVKPTEQLLWLGQLRSSVGADAPAYSAMMAQLAPDEPVLALAGEYAGKDRVEAARLMLEGQAILRPPRRTDGTPDQGKLWPMPPDADLRKRFQSLESDAFAGNAKYRNMVEQGTKAIYAKLTEQEGDASGVINTRRLEQAFRLASGGVEHYRGRAVVLPYGIEFSEFRAGVNARIDDINAGRRLAEGVSVEQLRNMPLDAIGDGRYVFRSGDSYLVDRHGKRLELNFNLEPTERPRPSGWLGERRTGRGAEPLIPPWERAARPIERTE